ncbi:MAG: hypothetical protein KatS3mg103_1092 [Phycisphaerales bacterium]|nr:MAG: hypothetical protein KatS3mg103_1092 [Phycisphaerales bacterium]
MQLRNAADKYPAQLSGGMKKRAGLARAMALDPQLLFCDEPSAGLDPVTSAQIDRLLVDLTKKLGIACVVVTHEMDSAFAIADRMAMLDKGRMLAVRPRSWFERIRAVPREDVGRLSEDEQIIHQFVCGLPDGPLSERLSESDWEEDIWGCGRACRACAAWSLRVSFLGTKARGLLRRLQRILGA